MLHGIIGFFGYRMAKSCNSGFAVVYYETITMKLCLLKNV